MRRKLFVKVLAVLMAGTMLIGCGANAGDSSQSSENLVENSTELSSQPSQEEENTEVTEVAKNEETTENTAPESETSEEVTTESEKPEEPTPTPEPEEPKQPDNPAPVHEHDYTKVITKHPTCRRAGELGEAVFTCSCGDSYTREIDCVTCEGDGVRVRKEEPTCRLPGVTVEHCKWCYQEMFHEEIPIIDHVPGNYLEVSGKMALYCIHCGKLLDVKPIE